MRDILVFTPVLRLEPETVRALMALEWSGPLTLVLQRDNARRAEDQTAYADHLHQYQRGRDLFLRGDYEAMLVIESDIVPPSDTLQRLAALADEGADLAYGVYLYRGGRVVNILERYRPDRAKPARNIGQTLTTRGLYAAACEQGVIECSGSGLGCVLIKREVIEAVPFAEYPSGKTFFDMAWTKAVYSAGYRMVADMGIRCGHVDPDHGVLWPDRDQARHGAMG